MYITNILKPFVTELRDIQRSPPNPNADELRRMSIVSEPAAVLYDDGAGTRVVAPVWTYAQTNRPKGPNDAWIGPMLQARQGRSLQIEWSNDVPHGSTNPIFTARDPAATPGGDSIPQNVMGSPSARRCLAKPYFVTHLHGAATAPNYDGWPESMTTPPVPGAPFPPSKSRRVRYDNIDRAAMYWYHDHAMHTTAWNVFAGMAGPYVVIDGDEDWLADTAARGFKMPAGRDEIAMVLRDCNLTLDPQTELQPGDHPTQLLHKIEDSVLTVDGSGIPKWDGGVIECFGPINMVNGTIWPKRIVDPGVYRLRILNGANARTYALSFVTEDAAGNWTIQQVPVTQIGSDGGLMSPTKPLDLANAPLVMMPAERVDLLVDFTDFANRQLVLINRAKAPFIGKILDYTSAPGKPDQDGNLNPYPQVMRFDVKQTATAGHPSTQDMTKIVAAIDARVTLPALPTPTKTRTIALLEKNMGEMAPVVAGQPPKPKAPMLTTLELVPAGELLPYDGGGQTPYQALMAGRAITITEPGKPDATYRVAAERFQDPVNFEVLHGATEIWRFINLSPDSHPMHLHLVQFRQTAIKSLSRVYSANLDTNAINLGTNKNYAPEEVINGAFVNGEAVTVAVGNGAGATLETGLKDTIRVDPMTMVEITATFEGYLGRYLYHCHLLEHEDHDMMRQFVVTRDDLPDVMPHHGMHPPGSIGR